MRINFNTIQQPYKSLYENSQASPSLPGQPKDTFVKSQPSFSGGYSVSLKKTLEGLDKLAGKNGLEIYPKNIREWAQAVLEENPKTKDTLIDVHKKYYESIKECFSLAEVKKKFPEFKNVLSDSQVDYRQNSFMDKVKNGEIEYFDKDEDLSLQLLKLYWSDGFSLNDLKRYSDNADLYHTIKKLNIPTVQKDYGHILKFSDVEYNERLTKEMTERRLETIAKKACEETGEPVYIKRGPMSYEHKQKITDALIKFYEENPQRIFEMSERQKEFYVNNPERAEIFEKVLKKAWGIQTADRIKNALSGYMSRNGAKDFKVSDLNSPLSMSEQKSKLLKKFWATNEWAKKMFSNNMTYAWKKVKEQQNASYFVSLAPKGFAEKFLKWSKQNGIDTSEFDFGINYFPEKAESTNFNSKINLFTPMFIDAQPYDESRLLANTHFLALLNINRELGKLKPEKLNGETKELVGLLKYKIKQTIFTNPDLPIEKNSYRVFGANEIQEIYNKLHLYCASCHNTKFIEMFNLHLDKAYSYLDKLPKDKSVALDPRGLDL